MSTTPLAAKEPVAIIGTGCRFPGSASSPSRLWKLLKEPYDLRRKLPDSRFNPEGVYHPDNKHHGTSNVKHSYILDEDHRHFDAQFFGIKPAEASSMDPQQRHLLEVIYEGLEAAGQKIENLKGSSTAVYVGLMYGEYGEMLAQQPDELPTYMATGTARSIMANRVSYFFDWHGPSMTIDTACSSSLVALHHAVQSLRLGECPIAVAAGSNLCLGPESYIAESKLQMLSPNGRSRMWDADADGYARGDGVAAVVLKLLKDAIADGDNIECIIRETAVNQDGRTRGITMPSSQAQTDLIRKTYSRAGLDLANPADRPQYFEAHGTGTPAGDPIEAEAIHEAFFGDGESAKNHSKLYVGSIKSIIGHTEGTAGLAGVIKASLAIQNKVIPPNLWFHQLNPAIEPFYTQLHVPTEPINWPGDASAVRRASVNSFGFGGTNAHAILEGLPQTDSDHTNITKQHDLPFSPLTFSAHSEGALLETLSRYVQHIKDGFPLDAHSFAQTLNSHRSQFEYRYAFGIDLKQTLLENLESHIKLLQSKETQISSKTVKPDSTRILGIFTGQGAQYGGMIRELYLKSPKIRQTVEEFEKTLARLPESLRPTWSLAEELLKTGKDSRVGEAALSQPLSTVVQIILVNLLRAAGIQFSAVVGHSSGEIVASYAAGFLLAADAVRIAYLRGLVTSTKTSRAGRMLAVNTSYEDATELCNLPNFEGRLCIAAVNSSSSLTLSGDLDVVEGVKDILEDEEKFARLLKVDKAYHSHHMLEFSQAYSDCLLQQHITIQKPPPGSPLWVSSVDVDSFRQAPPDLSSGYWVRNLIQPVLFYQAITKAVLDLEVVHLAIEIGPHPALQAPASQNLQENIEGEDVVPYIGVLRRGQDSAKAFGDGIARIWTVLGPASKINLKNLEQFLTQSKQPEILKNLPTYPWVHERLYWHEARESKIRRARNKRPNLLLGHRSTEDPGQQFRWRNILTPREIPWLSDHRIQGQRCFPAAGYVAAALEAAAAISKDNEMLLIELQDIVLGAALNFDDDDSRVMVLFTVTDIDHVHQQDTSILISKFHYFSASSNDAGPMILNAEGRLIIHYGSGSKDTLPQSAEVEPGFTDVDHDRFYESMAPLGYGYTGPFRALSSLKRKLGAVNGIVAQPANEEQTLIVHPAMLDCTIQSVLLAYSYPGDGRLWSLHIPTRIQNVLVNPQLSAASQAIPVRHYMFDTTLVDTEGLGVTGNISVHTTGGQMLLRMEGMQAIPLERAQPENDRKLFSKVVWDVATPDVVKTVRGERATPDDYRLAELLERVSHFYLRRLDNAFPATDPIRSDGSWVGMLGFAHQIVESVQQGTHVCARADWVDDDEKIIEAEIQKFPESIDLKIARIIGKNIVSVVRGESTMLEHLRVGDTLDDYYANAMGIHYTEYMARLAQQLSFKKPDLNFLEIGAGTGAATKSIFREIGNSYKTYTFTDISSAFFESAQTTFSDHLSTMRFSTLDIEKDPEEQGYKPHYYDVVVASLVVHATHNLKNTLTRIRQLLKPGGHLLLLELTNLNLARISFIFGSLPGWWLGEEPYRRYNPCVTTQQWGELLQESGFSGVDTVTPDKDALPFPASVIVSQAVNDEVSFLREPLYSRSELETFRISPSMLLIIGGRSKPVSKFSRIVKSLTTQYFARGTFEVGSVEQVQATDFDPSGTTVLFLADLDKNIFEGLDEQRFEGLKLLFNHAQRIVWVTNEARDNNPFHLMSIGFGRSMSMELPHVQTQYIDLTDVSTGIAFTVAEMLIRFDALTSTEAFLSEQILWPIEPEISIDTEKQLIHRIIHDTEKNHRYNSIRRDIALDTQVDAENPVEVSLGTGGYHLVPQRPQPNQGESKVVETLFSTVTAVKLDDTSSLHIGLGTVDSRPVAYLTESIATRVSVLEELAVQCEDISPQFLGALSIALIAGAVVHTSSDYIVVVEPDGELAFAIRAHASNKPISLIFLTTDVNKAQPHYHYIHSSIGISDLDLIIPQGARRVLLTGRAKQVESRIKTWAQSRKIEVASLAPVVQSYRSPRSPLIGLQKLLQSSIPIAEKLQQSSFEVLTLQDVTKFFLTKSHGLTIPIVDFRPIKAPVTIEPVDKYALLRGDHTYWLVGLSRSLGLSLCNWMIDHGAKNVVISSRSPVVDKSALKAIRNKGANVQIIPCDIVDKQSVVAAHRLIQSTMPPIAGVANGAMVLRDTMLDDMTVDDMNAVIHPKVTGSINLNDLFLNTQLDFFIFLSSAIGMTGNVGQCNYAAANIFMHGLAAKRRKNGLAASVMVIGVILGVGYVTRETSQSLQDNLKKSGHNWLSEKDFHILFGEAIRDSSAFSSHQSEIIVGIKSIRLDTDHIPPWANNPRFSHFILQSKDGVAAFSASNEKVPLRTKFLEATSMQEIYEAFRGKKDELVDHVISMLRMDNSLPKAQFLQYTAGTLGIDSLNAVDLRAWFMKKAKIDVPVLRILGGATLGDLLDFALNLLPTEVAPAKSPDFKPNSKPAKTSAPTPAKAKLLKVTSVLPQDLTAVSKSTSTSTSVGSSSNVIHRERQQLIPQGSAVLPKPAASIELTEALLHPASSSTSGSTSGESFSIINHLSLSSASSQKNSEYVSVSKEKPDVEQILRSENLSRGQSRFWFLQSYVEDSTTFNITCLFKLQGIIDVAKLEKAVATIGRRHEALRTSISDYIHDTVEQHVLEEANLFLEAQTWFEQSDVQLKYDELKEYSYDFERGALMRIILLSPYRSLTREHYLLIGYHHINMDGVSLEIVLKELEDLYSGRSLDKEPFQFADYASYENQKLSNGGWDQSLSYWKEKLGQAPDVFPVLPFGQAKIRQATRKYSHVKKNIVIESDTKKLIQKACRTYRVSPYHFYLATYLALLARWAEVPEVCIGSSYANRHDSNRQTSVGNYLNPVGLRLPYDKKKTFVSALETARQISSEASLHSEVPFDVLLDHLKVERNPVFSPIFQTFINYRPRTDESRSFGSSTLTGVEYESGKTPYDIMLDVFDGQSDQSRVEIRLQKYLYSEDAVETLARSYLSLVNAFARNPMQPLGNAPLHSDRDLRDAAEIGRGPMTKLTWGPTMIHRIEDLCRKHSSKLAIQHRIEDTLTFGDMADRVDRIYEALSDAGVVVGSAVGVHMQASADWICSILAIIKYGSIYVPLDIRQGKSRLTAIIKECQPAAILVDGQTFAPAEDLTSDGGIQKINLTNVVGSAKIPTPILTRASDQAAFYYTSGSTGTPKGIPLTNEGIFSHMEGMSDRLKVSFNDVMLQQTAFSFDFSLWQILIAFTNAASIVIVPDHLRRDAVGIVDLMVKSNVTMTASTPSEYSSWLQYGALRLRDSAWTRILCGGEPMPHGFLENLSALGKADLKLEHLYGPTEITFIATTCPLDYSKKYTTIPIGRPIANYTIVILNKNGEALPAGVLGEIAIGGPSVSTQYLNKPEESGQKFRPSIPALEEIGVPPFRFHMTGDEGWLSSEGLLYISGRIAGDTQIKLRGQRLDLLDVEQAIVNASSGSILGANVSASRDANGADFLVAQVVLRHDGAEIDLPGLAASLPLQQFMRPSVIFAVDKFPVTGHGKRDRRALASVDVFQVKRPKKNTSMRLSLEQQRLLSIWKDILPEETVELHEIGPETDFFAIGGTSLTILELQKRFQKDLGARIEIATLFESSSLRQMTVLLEEQTQLTKSEEKQIDWEKETQLELSAGHFRNAKSMKYWTASSSNGSSIIVILTGATGFLGKALLRALIATKEVAKVHCLAVRQVEKLSNFVGEPTVHIYTGDLTSPRLGLSEEEAHHIFSESHIIIHNGADVSFLKTYASLRQANVQSTRELINLSLTHVDGGHDFHFVSTAGVLGFSGEREFPNITASGFHPPVDGSFGYSASKWVSERILERASDAYGMSVSIYRPTNITGDETPELDLVHNVIKYSQVLKVVPDPKGIWDGFINLVSIEKCTANIISSILYVAYGRETGVRYLHVTGPEDIPINGLKSHLERNDRAGTWYKQIGLAQWVAKAERAGLKPLTGAYLKKLATENQEVYLTRVLNEKGTADRLPLEKSSSWSVLNTWRRTKA